MVLSIGHLPRQLKDQINQSTQLVLGALGYPDPHIHLITDLSMGVMAIDAKLNDDLRKGRGSSLELSYHMHRPKSIHPLTPVFSHLLLADHRDKQDEISDGFIRTLALSKPTITDRHLQHIATEAFKGNEDIYSLLETQRGARRVGLPTPASKFVRSHGGYIEFLRTVLDLASLNYRMAGKKSQGRNAYEISDGVFWYKLDISQTRNIPAHMGMGVSYQSIQTIPGTHRAHFI